MESKKILFEDYKKKRIEKFKGFANPVSKDSLYSLVGDYAFDNFGVSYLDLSEYDFSLLSLEDMTNICFSSSTLWPSKEKLPKGFDPEKILKDCCTVGDEIKKLHDSGVDGEGVTVAVIDTSFQGGNHKEFEGANLECVTLDSALLDENCHFHMENVLAKIVGKSLGVAPKCKVLYYEINSEDDNSEEILKCLKDIERRIEAGESIRAVNISASIEQDEEDAYLYQNECLQLVETLSKKRCEVVDSTRFGEDFFCCGSTFMSNNINNYKEASFIKNYSCELKEKLKENVNFVCSGRNVLEFCNDVGYKYEVVDCFSWSIPQAIGLYALCLQKNKNIDWDVFTLVCKETSLVNDEGICVVNPLKVVEKIKNVKIFLNK